MKNINLFWWHWEKPNLGDVASEYIVRHLTECNINRQGLPISIELKQFLSDIIHFKYPTNFSFLMDSIRNKKDYIVGLGSIIQYSSPTAVVWGSGFQNPNDPFAGGKIVAVRGPRTANELVKRGYSKCTVYGDPGLLMPLLFQPKPTQNMFEFGVIPHFREFDSIRAKIKSPHIQIIDLRTDDVEGSIRKILNCRKVISSSLHGLIFSQSYGIPAVLFKSFHTSNWQFKNLDYLESVGISPYDPIDFSRIDTINESFLEDIFSNYIIYSKINIDLFKLQKQLLNVAPFELKDKFIGLNLLNQIEEEKQYLLSLPTSSL